ncbi:MULTISPECIES: LytTR family DNA-binding domain-containing protein [unclassified Fibrobacter]|uniref:LytR/AlgR family response regulator transcription factor n=1 Tax=unclassified Fibrobacter TaxID=2634177 RepID=UPI000915B4F6|nr:MULTISPECIES: response regulator transcription factor [unclassified Fibrobacter]OWV15244.1 DNA-binding response regulator [Fibrobacter sp. UWH1]SHK98834.1 two component transcriptional regulator, LytTR family [Fibrobacter sp. UWH5]
MKVKTLVIDDEPWARARIISMLGDYASEFDIQGEAESGAQAIKAIQDHLPDVVFLDIQMPDMDAFDVLHALNPEEVPYVVFTTAYDEFALKAFEENTVDYLLKPFDSERLMATVEKLRKIFPDDGFSIPAPPDFTWKKFRNVVDLSNFYLQRIQVRKGDRCIFLSVDEVVRFQTEGRFTMVYTMNEMHIVDVSTMELEKRLDPMHFIRVNRSTIVSIDHIAEYRKVNSRITMVLRDKSRTELVVSQAMFKKIRSL